MMFKRLLRNIEFKKLWITFAIYFGGLLVLAIFMDQVAMPIIVHKGDDCLVPDITNMSTQAAEIKLGESDLQMTVALEEFSAQVPKGVIITQLPDPGSSVKRGMKVRVTVSKGAASATVPNLRGVTLREAKLMLEKEGLVMGDLLWFNDDEVLPDGVIIATRPPAGTVMKLNAEVQLLVNRKYTDVLVKVPDFVGLDFSEAEQVAEESFLIIGDLSYKVDDRMLPETVLYQSIAPDSLVPKWTIVGLTISQTE